MIPHPGFRIDRLTHGAEESERGKIARIGELISRFYKGANGGWSSVENGDAVFLDDIPEATEVGMIGGTFIHDLSHAIGERSVGDVGMAGDPADISGAPVDIVILHVENVFAGGVSAGEITAGGVEDSLGFSGGS